MLRTRNIRDSGISLILLALSISVSASNEAVAHAPTLDEMSPKGLIAWQSQRIELAPSVGLQSFVRSLDHYKGRDKLNIIQYLLSNFYDNSATSTREFNKWNKYLREYSTSLNDRRFIDVANLNDEYKRFYAGNTNNQGILSFSTRKYD